MNILKYTSKISKSHQFAGLSVFILLYGVLVYLGKDQIYWEGTQNLFRCSTSFFQTTWTSLDSNPIATFFANRFLLQFFIFPYIGALIIIVMYGMLYAIVRRLLTRLNVSPIFSHYGILAFLIGFTVWMFLPVFSFFFLLPMLVFYGAIDISIRIENICKRRILGCILGCLLPFFIGAWTLGFVLFFILHEIKICSFKSALLSSVIVLISTLTPPYFWKYLHFAQIYENILMTIPQWSSISKNSWIWGVMILPFILLICTLFKPKIGSVLKDWMGYAIFGTTFVVAVVAGLTNKDFRLDALYYRAERQVEHKEWDSVLSTCQRYLEITESDSDKGLYYPWIVDNTKFALCQTGQLMEDFFTYNKYLGFGILFPQAIEFADKSHPGVYNFFSSVGLHSESVHSAFERVLSGTSGPLVLDNLIKSHLVLGDYRPCVEFVNILDESLLFKKQAKHYRHLLKDTAVLNTDSFYVCQRALLAKKEFQSNWNIDQNMYNLFLSNFDNQRAFEYTLTMMLSYKEYYLIVEHLDLLGKFNYSHIPRHIEEALLILFNYGVDSKITKDEILNSDFSGLKIREETIRRCDDFFTYLDKYNMGLITSKTIQERFGDTYWYHFLFVELKPIELQGQASYEVI